MFFFFFWGGGGGILRQMLLMRFRSCFRIPLNPQTLNPKPKPQTPKFGWLYQHGTLLGSVDLLASSWYLLANF